MTIYEVLESGPICAGSEELGLLVTVNGSYVNLWVSDGTGGWTNTDCKSGHPDLYKLTGADMIDLAERCLDEWTTEDDE